MIEIDGLDDPQYYDFTLLRASVKSHVIQAMDEHSSPVLLKSFRKGPDHHMSFVEDSSYNQMIPKELFYLTRLSENSYVPQLLNYHDGEEWSTVVMEYLGKGWMDLFDFFTSENDEYLIRRIIKNVIGSMYDMCEKGFYHQDIKPENIMVNARTLAIKLIDFEDMLHSESENPTCDRNVGTIGYRSPESFDRNLYDVKQSLVFSIGCLAYTCIENRMAFNTKEQTQLCRSLETRISSLSASSFIRMCTKRNAKERIDFHELLNHKWFKYCIN